MLKSLTACAALLVLGAASVNADQQDLVLHKMEVPGANFDMVIIMPKAWGAGKTHLRDPDLPPVVRPTGDELAFATDREIESIFGSRYLIHAFRVEPRNGDPSSAVHVYVVSKTVRHPRSKGQ